MSSTLSKSINRYINDVTRWGLYLSTCICTWRVGRMLQNLFNFWAKFARTGSMVDKMVPHSPAVRRNSVMQATMQTFDSGRTLDKAASKEVITSQSMTSAFFMASRDAMLRLVILRRTLLSPTIENSQEDILTDFKSWIHEDESIRFYVRFHVPKSNQVKLFKREGGGVEKTTTDWKDNEHWTTKHD